MVSSNQEVHANYFKSYGDLKVHALMLLDIPRTSTYKKAIEANAESIQGRTVIDVGAGTGILSFFAAKHGAKRVFAIEGCPKMARLLRILARQNHLESIISVVDCQVEEIDNLEKLWQYPTIQEEDEGCFLSLKENDDGSIFHERIDILISEWMGFYLLHESMLTSVLIARDRFLKQQKDGGLLLPDKASLYLSLLSSPKLWYQKRGWYTAPFHDFDFSPLETFLHQPDVPIITEIQPQEIYNGTTVKLMTFDLWTLRDEDLKDLHFFTFIKIMPPIQEVTTIDNSPINEQQSAEISNNDNIHGFVFWFDVEFPVEINSSSIKLDTSPYSSLTHWKQCVLLFDQPQPNSFPIELHCQIDMRQEDRCYKISIAVIDALPLE